MKTIILPSLIMMLSFMLSACMTVSNNSPKNLSPDNEVCGNLKQQIVANTSNLPDQSTYNNPITDASLYRQYAYYDCERDEESYQPPLLRQNNPIHLVVQ